MDSTMSTNGKIRFEYALLTGCLTQMSFTSKFSSPLHHDSNLEPDR